MRRLRRWLPTFLIVSGLVAVDRATKLWALAVLQPGEALPFLPGLQWTLAFNRGIAWSHFHNVGPWAYRLLVAVIMALTLIVGWIVVSKPLSPLERVGYTLVFSGAVGNIWDRLQWGWVVDFIEVFYRPWYWPVFNVADSLICVGIACLMAALCTKGDVQ